MQNLIKRLEKRGWRKNEISKAVGIIQKAKQNKTKENLFLEKRIYWILLVVIITANFAIAISILPLLLALRGFGLYFIIIVIGGAFGFLFELVIRSIEHLERNHHLILAAVIPIIAIINAYIVAKMSNNLNLAFGIKNFHEPLIAALAYAASFVLPYIICKFVFKKEYYSE